MNIPKKVINEEVIWMFLIVPFIFALFTKVPECSIDIILKTFCIGTWIPLLFFFYNKRVKHPETGFVYSIGTFIIIIFVLGRLLKFEVNHYLLYFLALLSISQYLSRIKNISLRQIFNLIIIFLLSSILLSGSFLKSGDWAYFGVAKVFRDFVHQDYLMHVAIAISERDYGVSSTMLNGIQAINYHTFSHKIIAAVSKLLNISVADTYGFFYPMIVIPLFILSLIFLVSRLCEVLDSGIMIKILLILIILLNGFFNYGENGLFYFHGVWNNYLSSESYIFALMFLFGCWILILEDQLYPVIISLLFVIISAFSKISVGASALMLFLAHIIFINKTFQKKTKVILSIIGMGITLGAIVSVREASGGSGVSLNHFIKEYGGLGDEIKPNEYWLYVRFFIVHFFFPISLFAFMFSKDVFFNYGKYLLYIIPTLLMGLIAVVFLRVPGGSVFYISNISMMISIPMLIPVILKGLEKRSVTTIVYIIVGVYGLLSFEIKNSYLQYKQKYSAHETSEKQRNLNKYNSILAAIRNDSTTLNSAIYLPKSEKDFWDLYEDQNYLSLLIPAVSERVGIFILPDVNKSKNLNRYGFPSYSLDDFKISAKETLDPSFILSESLKKGFSGYMQVKNMQAVVFRE